MQRAQPDATEFILGVPRPLGLSGGQAYGRGVICRWVPLPGEGTVASMAWHGVGRAEVHFSPQLTALSLNVRRSGTVSTGGICRTGSRPRSGEGRRQAPPEAAAATTASAAAPGDARRARNVSASSVVGRGGFHCSHCLCMRSRGVCVCVLK